MKTRLFTAIFTSIMAVVLCFAAGRPAKDRPAKIQSCIQFPGTHVPQPNLDNIIKTLEQDREYPQNYRVRVWNNGKMTRDIGHMQIKKEVSETDNYAKSSGLTSVTVRVGYCDIRISYESDHHFEDADALVRELGPLLPKYR